MARIPLGGLTTLNTSTHLDPMFVELYDSIFDPDAEAGIQVSAVGLNHVERTGSPDSYSAVGQLVDATNNSTTPGYGVRVNYRQTGAQTSGFSIGHGVIGVFTGTDGAQGLASWLVAASPTSAAVTFGIFGQEVNPINRSIDSGYAKRRGALSRWTGGIQVTPEADDLIGVVGNNCYHTTYGLAVTPSSGNKADGDQAKTYNGLLIERDSIALGGRGILASGDSSGNALRLPNYAMEVDERWANALYTAGGTFTNNNVAVFGNSQRLTWGTTATPAFIVGEDTGHTLLLGTRNLTTLRLDALASQVNYWQMYGGVAAGGPTLGAIGADPHINASIQGKGNGGVRLKDGATVIKIEVNTTGIGFFATTPVAQDTGWGTPTGSAKLINFPGATATLAQTSGALAALVTYLRSRGDLGA